MGVKRIVLATGKGVWKAGAYVTKVSGKTAGKGSVWVLKKVAVDPVGMRVKDWKMVKAGRSVAELKERLKKHGECIGCGKAFREHTKREFCTPACASSAAEQWNDYRRESVKPAVVESNDLYLNCGCNRKNLFHGAGCAVGLNGHRVADNIKWSEKNPEHMKPAGYQQSERTGQRGRYSEKQLRALDEAARKMAEKSEKPKRGWW